MHADSDSNGACDVCGYTMVVTPPVHTHDYGSTWVTDENNHWKVCACEAKAEEGTHADSDSNGACDVCGYAMATSSPEPTPPVDEPVDPTPSDDPDEGLSVGAIIAIIAGAVVVVGGGGFAIFWFGFRKKGE